MKNRTPLFLNFLTPLLVPLLLPMVAQFLWLGLRVGLGLGLAAEPAWAQPGRAVALHAAGEAAQAKDANDQRNKRGADLRMALAQSKGQDANAVAGAKGKFRPEPEPDAKSGLLNAADNSASPTGAVGPAPEPRFSPKGDARAERHLSAKEREEMRDQLRQQRAKR